MFGLPIDTPRERYWGARAIYQNGRIDLLPDRQMMDAAESPETTAFVLWLNGHALPWLRKEVKRLGLSTSDPQEIVLSQFKYELRASTNASYGYLYIGAVEHKLVECEPHINPTTQSPERMVMVRDQKFVVDAGVVPVGTEGVIRVNSIGPAKVVGYYNERYTDDFKLASLMVEVLTPPEWMLKQNMRRDLEAAIKRGDVPLKRGSKTEPSPTAAKKFEKEWKLGPLPIYPIDFVANEAKAA